MSVGGNLLYVIYVNILIFRTLLTRGCISTYMNKTEIANTTIMTTISAVFFVGSPDKIWHGTIIRHQTMHMTWYAFETVLPNILQTWFMQPTKIPGTPNNRCNLYRGFFYLGKGRSRALFIYPIAKKNFASWYNGVIVYWSRMLRLSCDILSALLLVLYKGNNPCHRYLIANQCNVSSSNTSV